MPLDLQQFEKLDTYASQVGELAPLPTVLQRGSELPEPGKPNLSLGPS